MFPSAGNSGSSSSVSRPTARSSYSSFQSLFNAKKAEIRADRKRNAESSTTDSDSSGSSSDGIQVINEVIRERVLDKAAAKKKRKKQERKERKREKKRKSHKKKAKKRRKESSSSSSDTDMEVETAHLSDFFVHTSKKDLSYNTAFAKQQKKRPVHMDLRQPLTLTRDAHDLGLRLYPAKEEAVSWRYFSPANVQAMKKGATERIFRRLPSVRTETFIPLSKTPFQQSEENDSEAYAEYTNEMPYSEYVLMKKRRWADPDTLPMDEKRELIKAEVNANERNVEKWLAFIKFEDEYFAYCNQVQGTSSDFGRPAFLERRLEILRNALKKVRMLEAVELQLEIANTLAELYGPHDQQVRDQWSKIQTIYVSSPAMWRVYISERLHGSSRFDVKIAEEAFNLAISRLDGLFNGRMLSHKADPSTEDFLIDLVVSRCQLFLEAGYVAYAIGNLQAIAQFLLFMPPDLKRRPHRERVDAFGEFWSSGRARLGDLEAKGWRDAHAIDAEEENRARERAVEVEAAMAVEMDKSNCELVRDFSGRIDRLVPSIWNQMEEFRTQHCWRPVIPLEEFEDDERFQYIKDRVVPFDKIKHSLIELPSGDSCMRLIFRILQLFGVKVPGMLASTQQGVLQTILPDDFAFLHRKYAGIKDFFTEFLFQLTTTSEKIEVGHVLATIVACTTHFAEMNGEDGDVQRRNLQQLQGRIRNLPVDQNDRFFACLRVIDRATSLQMADSLLGVDLPALSEQAKRVVPSYLSIIGTEDPCAVADARKRQLLLEATTSLVRRLPSRWSTEEPGEFTRLRFLAMLVAGENVQTTFLNASEQLSERQIEAAAVRWNSHFTAAIDEQEADQSTPFSYMPSAAESIVLLCAIFAFELDGRSIFAESNPTLAAFIERTPDRLLLRLDFVEQLTKIHRSSWRQYAEWVRAAADRHPDHSAILRHLTSVYAATPCHVVRFKDWKMESAETKKQRALAVFAAKMLAFKKAAETDDDHWIQTVLRELQLILEEAAPVLSNSHFSDSFIWRIWLLIQREFRYGQEMDNVYILGSRACPFSKQFLMDVTRFIYTKEERLHEILQLADENKLLMFTTFDEAKAIEEAAS